jgi:hypothetical protein
VSQGSRPVDFPGHVGRLGPAGNFTSIQCGLIGPFLNLTKHVESHNKIRLPLVSTNLKANPRDTSVLVPTCTFSSPFLFVIHAILRRSSKKTLHKDQALTNAS